MKVIMLLFDSLNRHMLTPYGCQWTKTPNFKRLAEKAITFDNCYAGSLPCMPARRELHTGRLNFLHRSWGPLEPFDDSLPEILRANGIYSHLISDHQHYWEDGGATYHQRYDTWEIVRGQEADKWKGQVKDPAVPAHLGQTMRQDLINRTYFDQETSLPQAQVFQLGFEFLEQNKKEDNWFLHLESFDPHEPFFGAGQYQQLYPHTYSGPVFDWPDYAMVTESREAMEHCRYEYAALLSMCDANLGRLLDFMDLHKMWDDTMLIVNTDHGFLLGEHDRWAKSVHPFYNEIAHIPLFIWHPAAGNAGGRRNALVQTIDIAPTILNCFAIPPTKEMTGKSLVPVMENDSPVRDYALFGMHGAQLNITDGRYVYMRDYHEKEPIYNYTLMPTHMKERFSIAEMQTAKLHPGFSFTKDCPVMQITDLGLCSGKVKQEGRRRTELYDLTADPQQQHPLTDEALAGKLQKAMAALMTEHDAPPELFARFGLEKEGTK